MAINSLIGSIASDALQRATIIFNYNQAINQAEKIDGVANQLTRLANDRYASTIGGIKAAWQSDYSGEYYLKTEKVRDDILNTARLLKKIASNIRTTADTVRKAELRALEIARRRSSCGGGGSFTGGGGGGAGGGGGGAW